RIWEVSHQCVSASSRQHPHKRNLAFCRDKARPCLVLQSEKSLCLSVSLSLSLFPSLPPSPFLLFPSLSLRHMIVYSSTCARPPGPTSRLPRVCLSRSDLP